MRICLNILLSLVAISLMLSSCKRIDDKDEKVKDSEVKSDNLIVNVSNSFNSAQKSVVQVLFDKYDRMSFSSENELYRRFFGGDSINYLHDFINKRIKYFVPIDEKELEKSFGDATKAIGAGYSLMWMYPVCNPSVGIPRVLCNGKVIKLKSSRHGVVVSGPAFFNSSTTDVERRSILAHEARHADCPVEPDPYMACYLIEDPDNSTVTKENKRCGYIHAKCNDNDSARACDDLSWGSYAVSYIVLEKIHQECLSCTEEERQVALLLSKEYDKRFLINKDKIFEGTPDLSSYDE